MSSDNSGDHCAFVLLAEFDKYEGAQLRYQFPQPLGVDEGVLAMSMVPDGAETQSDDWTVFFLNQTPFNTIAPVLALETDGGQDGVGPEQPGLLCVLNLVRTKLDKAEYRGATVRALAICTRHPFIQVFKPILLMAMDDYFSDPSQDCLSRLFDAINAMDLSDAPILSRAEKIVMRCSDRTDIFSEKILPQETEATRFRSASTAANSSVDLSSGASKSSRSTKTSTDSDSTHSSSEDGVAVSSNDPYRSRPRAGTGGSSASSSRGHQNKPPSPSEASFSLGESAVWVGDESTTEESNDGNSVLSMAPSGTLVGGGSQLGSQDKNSLHAPSSVHSQDTYLDNGPTPTPTYRHPRTLKDTHFFNTTIAYKGHQLPIKMPLSTFPEEVGDYSLITLIKVFNSHQQVSGPMHPHLHTNGPQTHPIILLFNALITGKRIIFLGHKRPAGEVSAFVLSACALGSGCGVVLRGFIERAFPYANLQNRHEWELLPAYIAGVTNPIFESSRMWDLLLDIGSGNVVVAKEINTTYPPAALPSLGGFTLNSRTGTLKSESSAASEDDMARSKDKAEPGPRAENNVDTLFIEDIRSAIEFRFGETMVRMRFTEYVQRFVRLAARYEESASGGTTNIGCPTVAFCDGSQGRAIRLGSGIMFSDDANPMKELTANAYRIEAWRKTNSYRYCVEDFNLMQATNAIQGFDVLHQLVRLRHARTMPDAEVALVMRTLTENVKSYEQVVELLSYVIPQGGGLLHLAFGLFHQQEFVRDMTVELLNQLRCYPIGVLFLQAMNHFHRYAYVRQAYALEKRLAQEQQPTQPGNQPPQHSAVRMTRAMSSSKSIVSGFTLPTDKATPRAG
ncbi:hypothetical protein HGRIS_003026 [Hohenbuehelia grisea]|uniref:Arf3-interacting protein 1 N-terminal domain-containing protein n=1 Tax=Hohenbuehelia grisea TaxID=104357 RepID=A0ABR3JMF0_9AGAR